MKSLCEHCGIEFNPESGDHTICTKECAIMGPGIYYYSGIPLDEQKNKKEELEYCINTCCFCGCFLPYMYSSQYCGSLCGRSKENKIFSICELEKNRMKNNSGHVMCPELTYQEVFKNGSKYN